MHVVHVHAYEEPDVFNAYIVSAYIGRVNCLASWLQKHCENRRETSGAGRNLVNIDIQFMLRVVLRNPRSICWTAITVGFLKIQPQRPFAQVCMCVYICLFMCIFTCLLWWMCKLWVGQERHNPCVMSCEPPLSLPSQLLPPSLLFLQKTERQVLYSLLAMRWHHPVVHHILYIVHDAPCAAPCWREPAVLSLCVPWCHSVLSFNPLQSKCAWEKDVHTWKNTHTHRVIGAF